MTTKTKLIGRIKEQTVLQEALTSSDAELISVVGRRRVGKTFLIKTVYEEHICFDLAGVRDAPMKEQLQNFTLRFNRIARPKTPIKTPKNWLEVFYELIDYLEANKSDKKQVLFFDELPWLATKRSGFLRAFDVFWNTWAVYENIVVVICGSAASWMIRKVVNHKGGLHNRITRRLELKPFTLSETAAYLKQRNVFLDPYQMVQIYMAMGGIPHYLKEIKPGWSAARSIEEVCFSNTGLLKDEFSRLYPALFDDAENHIAIIRALAGKKKGLLRGDIIRATQLPSGGRISVILEELEQSGFIAAYYPFGKKKKGKLYRLTDEYSLFYLQFIENKIHEGEEVWHGLGQSQEYISWSGYAFENICLKHIPQIKKGLGISGVYSQSSTFYQKGDGDTEGAQIDLLIDRKDHVINLIEAKFYNKKYVLDKSTALALRERMGIFQEVTQTSKQLFWTLITTFGMTQNEHSLGLIQQVLVLEDLFEA